MADYLLCSSINYVQRTGDSVAICQGDYEAEVQSVTDNLIPLCREYFGKEVKILFTEQAREDNARCIYNWQTHTVEEDNPFENNNRALRNTFGNKLTTASRNGGGL